MYIVNGIQLPELDIFDADVAAKYEHEMVSMSDAMRIVDDSGSYSTTIHALCTPVFRCFDNLFGEGTAARIFAGKSNIKNCLKAVSELVHAVEAQKENIKSLPEEISSVLASDSDENYHNIETPPAGVPVRHVYTAEEVAAMLNRSSI